MLRLYTYFQQKVRQNGALEPREILSLRNAEADLARGRQDKDETQNQSCTYALVRNHSY